MNMYVTFLTYRPICKGYTAKRKKEKNQLKSCHTETLYLLKNKKPCSKQMKSWEKPIHCYTVRYVF